MSKMTELIEFCWDTKQQSDPVNNAWNESLSTDEIDLLIAASPKGRFEITEVDGWAYPLISPTCWRMNSDDVALQRLYYTAFHSLCTRGIIERWGGRRFLLSGDGQCLARDLAQARHRGTRPMNGKNGSEM